MKKHLTINKKLLLSNIGLVSTISLIIIISFITINLFKGTAKKSVESSGNTNEIIEFVQIIDNYLLDTITFNQLINNEAFNIDTNNFINQTKKDIEQIKKLKKENINLEKELLELTSFSIAQSNKYIEETSSNLAHITRRNNVSKLERLVINGANINTNTNYKITVLFLKLKENLKVKEELIYFLDTALINVRKDEQMLKGTPFAELPTLAKNANLRIKEIVIQYVSNAEDELRLINKLQEQNNNYIGNIMRLNSILSKEGREKILKTLSVFVVIVLIVLCCIVIFNYLLAKLLNNFISKADNDIKAVSEGNLSITIDKNLLKRKDEIGNISKSLQKMIIQFNTIISQISASNQQLSDASNQLSSASLDISNRANEQAVTTEEIASSMEQILGMIISNTQNAEKTGQSSEKTATQMKLSNEVFVQTIKSVSEISEKILVISEIADKTDILSINAAIEAARAGDSGKGFSVVANEIRKLADKTKFASDEITKLSKTGQEISKIAGEKLNNAIPEIIKSAELVNHITSASKEQQSSVENINASIQQLTEITNENSASAEEMSASAEELSAQAKQLKKLISVFNIRNFQNIK